MTTRERLIALKALLFGDETRWTKHNSARLASGKETIVRAPNAVFFCLAGGADRVVFNELGAEGYDQLLSSDWQARPQQAMLNALSDAIARVGFDSRIPRDFDIAPLGSPVDRVVRFNDSRHTNAADARLVLESAIEWAES